MKSIDKLSEELNVWTKKLEQKLIKAQQDTAKQVFNDVLNNTPIRTGVYATSIKIGETEVNDGTITTSVFSDLLVGGPNPKWAKVPLGALIEWGTGIEGSNTNTYPHGYGYRLTPWCYYDEYYHMYVTTTGMIARPHFQPALLKNKEVYIENLRKAVKK